MLRREIGHRFLFMGFHHSRCDTGTCRIPPMVQRSDVPRSAVHRNRGRFCTAGIHDHHDEHDDDHVRGKHTVR